MNAAEEIRTNIDFNFVTMLFFAFLALVIIFLISSVFCLMSSWSLVYVLVFGNKRIWRNTVINFDNTFDVWMASVFVALTTFYFPYFLSLHRLLPDNVTCIFDIQLDVQSLSYCVGDVSLLGFCKPNDVPSSKSVVLSFIVFIIPFIAVLAILGVLRKTRRHIRGGISHPPRY